MFGVERRFVMIRHGKGQTIQVVSRTQIEGVQGWSFVCKF
jgi:hypothetical protein